VGWIAELPESLAVLTSVWRQVPRRCLSRRAAPVKLSRLASCAGRCAAAGLLPPPLPLVAGPELPVGLAWRSDSEAVPWPNSSGPAGGRTPVSLSAGHSPDHPRRADDQGGLKSDSRSSDGSGRVRSR